MEKPHAGVELQKLRILLERQNVLADAAFAKMCKIHSNLTILLLLVSLPILFFMFAVMVLR